MTGRPQRDLKVSRDSSCCPRSARIASPSRPLSFIVPGVGIFVYTCNTLNIFGMSAKTGLSGLYSSPRATVDIVFIHGLHGNAIKTWTHESKGRGSICWPRDFLPSEISSARILFFGYDAHLAHFWGRPADNRIDTFSNDFFERLNNLRYNNGTTSRPIILVAHSLGGLICANALVDAANGLHSLQDVTQSVRRIAFLGAPLGGSEKARWAELGRRFLSIIKTTNKDLANELTPKSEKLAKLGEQFPIFLATRARNAATAIDVVCFYEGKSTRRAGLDFAKMVSKTSACLPGYQRILLEADHQNMARFKYKEDSNHQRISGLLQRWAKELDMPANNIPLGNTTAALYGQPAVSIPFRHQTDPLELDGNNFSVLPPSSDFTRRRLLDLAQLSYPRPEHQSLHLQDQDDEPHIPRDRLHTSSDLAY
ncbi:hypothetical protein FKW77_009950 [Venturia effusa]|uniref:AB hydrolase-1 domain-containing protein n=1 Tax=Venturia effusa TaxID=50376 RepID=A0A517L8A3_9PEZI|nr:hypothetical protein FKW77_009950 [Venturia effusa]